MDRVCGGGRRRVCKSRREMFLYLSAVLLGVLFLFEPLIAVVHAVPLPIRFNRNADFHYPQLQQQTHQQQHQRRLLNDNYHYQNAYGDQHDQHDHHNEAAMGVDHTDHHYGHEDQEFANRGTMNALLHRHQELLERSDGGGYGEEHEKIKPLSKTAMAMREIAQRREQAEAENMYGAHYNHNQPSQQEKMNMLAMKHKAALLEEALERARGESVVEGERGERQRFAPVRNAMVRGVVRQAVDVNARVNHEHSTSYVVGSHNAESPDELAKMLNIRMPAGVVQQQQLPHRREHEHENDHHHHDDHHRQMEQKNEMPPQRAGDQVWMDRARVEHGIEDTAAAHVPAVAPVPAVGKESGDQYAAYRMRRREFQEHEHVEEDEEDNEDDELAGVMTAREAAVSARVFGTANAPNPEEQDQNEPELQQQQQQEQLALPQQPQPQQLGDGHEQQQQTQEQQQQQQQSQLSPEELARELGLHIPGLSAHNGAAHDAASGADQHHHHDHDQEQQHENQPQHENAAGAHARVAAAATGAVDGGDGDGGDGMTMEKLNVYADRLERFAQNEAEMSKRAAFRTAATALREAAMQHVAKTPAGDAVAEAAATAAGDSSPPQAKADSPAVHMAMGAMVDEDGEEEMKSKENGAGEPTVGTSNHRNDLHDHDQQNQQREAHVQAQHEYVNNDGENNQHESQQQVQQMQTQPLPAVIVNSRAGSEHDAPAHEQHHDVRHAHESHAIEQQHQHQQETVTHQHHHDDHQVPLPPSTLANHHDEAQQQQEAQPEIDAYEQQPAAAAPPPPPPASLPNPLPHPPAVDPMAAIPQVVSLAATSSVREIPNSNSINHSDDSDHHRRRPAQQGEQRQPAADAQEQQQQPQQHNAPAARLMTLLEENDDDAGASREEDALINMEMLLRSRRHIRDENGAEHEYPTNDYVQQ